MNGYLYIVHMQYLLPLTEMSYTYYKNSSQEYMNDVLSGYEKQTLLEMYNIVYDLTF